MSLRYGARTRPGTMVSTWLNSLVSGTVSSGYFGGGTTGSEVSTVDKFSFSDDSRTTLGTGLSINCRGTAGMANSGTAGYFACGYSGGDVTTVDKFLFSDDSRTTLGTGLSSARGWLGAMANSGTAGYIGGGIGGGGRVSTLSLIHISEPTRPY